MTLSAATVWEFESGGSMNNGGGYVSGGTDYSQSPTPVLNRTNVYHTGGSVTITTDTDSSFTAAMVGNLLKVVSGTSATVGWYQIATYVDQHSVTLDRSINAVTNTAKDITINVGGALAYGIADQDTAFHAALIAGNTVWYSGGNTNPGTTYTLGGAISAGTAGSQTAPITLKGYKQTRGDACTSTYRPTIACGGYVFTCGTYEVWSNVIFTGTGASVLSIGQYSVVSNCKCTNSSGTASQVAFLGNISSYVCFAGCEGISTNGTAFTIYGSTFLQACYVHDSRIGVLGSNNGASVTECVVESCFLYGIEAYAGTSLTNNTIMNCGSGIYVSTAYNPLTIVNNIIQDCVTGENAVAAYLNNIVDYNVLYGNTTPRTNFQTGAHDLATDPKVTATTAKGTAGASVAGSLVFTDANNTFAGVTVNDTLVLFSGTGTGIKIGAYAISSVASIPGQVTLATDPTDTTHNISACVYGVVKGTDFRTASDGSGVNTGLQASTYCPVTV